MSDWNTTTAPGYRSKTIESRGVTITIHRPELTAKEMTKREQQVRDSLTRGLREYIGRKGTTA